MSLVIDYDVLDRLRVETCSRHFQHRWVAKIDLSLQYISTKPVDLDDFKLFISMFLYYSLYQGKLKVITHPHFSIRLL